MTERAQARERAAVRFLLLGVVLVGCAAQRGGQRSSASAGGLITDAASLQQAIREETTRFDDAESEMADCLRAAGYSYSERAVTVTITSPNGEILTRLESMRRYGYGISNGEGQFGVVAEVTGGASPTAESGELRDALADGGVCAAVVNGIDVQANLQDRADEFATFPEELASSEELQRALRQWASCMVATGFDYPTSAAAFDSLDGQYSQIASSDATERAAFARQEILAASADADCFEEFVQPAARSLMEDGA